MRLTPEERVGSPGDRKRKKPVFHWERFEPIPYELNWPMVADLKVTISNEFGAPTQTTVGQVLREAMPRRFATCPNIDDMLWAGEAVAAGAEAAETELIPEVEEGSVGSFSIRAAGRAIRVDPLGDNHFPAQMLRRALELLRMESGTGYRAQLFFYDSDFDSHEETWWEEFQFFVVVGDTIVQDSLELSSLCEQDIDNNVLKPAWYLNDGSWKTPGQDTGLRWWYRKFYTETKAGQFMILRTDAPRIFHYEPPEHRETANARHLAQMALATSWIAVAVSIAVAVLVLRLMFGRG